MNIEDHDDEYFDRSGIKLNKNEMILNDVDAEHKVAEKRFFGK